MSPKELAQFLLKEGQSRGLGRNHLQAFARDIVAGFCFFITAIIQGT
jgi:hypothetical protein